MEQYACLSLIYCYDEKLSLLQDREEPDWQSVKLDIGMEVTEALEPDDGRKRFVINKYFGRGLSGQYIEEQFREKHPEYDSQLEVVDDTACFSDSYDMKPKIQQVCSAIAAKAKKLNSHYTIFKQNWLYIFAPDLFTEFDLSEVLRTYREIAAQNSIMFDKVFLNAFHSIFVLNPNGLECEIPVSDDCLKQLKSEAQLRAEEKRNSQK